MSAVQGAGPRMPAGLRCVLYPRRRYRRGPIPGMPDGKPAGVRCVQLGDDLRCKIFGQPERPACCSGLQPQLEMCGADRAQALAWLTQLEAQTQPHADSR